MMIDRIYVFKQYLKERAASLHCNLLDNNLTSCQPDVEFTQDIRMDISFLIGTNSGLLLYQNGNLRRILPNAVYGITRNNGWYYVLQRRNGFARVLKFKLNHDNDVVDASILIDALSIGVHQIDFIGSLLFITDAYNNSIRVYRDNGKLVESLYPLGRLRRNDIMCGNYCHYNSIFAKDSVLYAVAHNNSIKTAKMSAIHKLDMNQHYKIVGKIDNIGFASHNVMIINDEVYWCDSLSSTIKCNHQVIAEIPGYLTRGMAVNDDYMVIGGSEFAFGADRLKSSGCVVIFDKNHNKVNTINITRSGGISEIRLLGLDYGLSASHSSSVLTEI